MAEHTDTIWPHSPAVRNDPKVIAIEAVDRALRDLWGPARIAGVVLILAYEDGTVSPVTNMRSKEEANRAISAAALLSGAKLLNSVKDLGE